MNRWLLLFSRDEVAFERLSQEARTEHLARCGRWAQQLASVTSTALVAVAAPAATQRAVSREADVLTQTPSPISGCCFIEARDEGDARDLALTHPDALLGGVRLVPLLWASVR